MSVTHRITFYPVSNGDTCQIVLANGRRILFDFNHRKAGEDPDSPHIDLKARLRDELEKARKDEFDVVAFTHADKDHICGSTDMFELRHAAKYQGQGRIKIRELWVPAAMVVETATQDQQSEEFVILRREARYRLLEGKGIRVFSKPKTLLDWLIPELKARGESANARDHLFVDAGEIVRGFSLDNDGIEFFCHSPFIKHCSDGTTVERNTAALIFNVRFRTDGVTHNFLQAGDTDWEVLEEIVDITREHGREDRLQWDHFNIPHHCSYLALSDEKGDQETEPKPLVKELLLYGQEGANIVSSSFPVPNTTESYERSLPPHIQARTAYESYLKRVGGRKLFITMEHPNENRPQPVEFEVSSGGITKLRGIVGGAVSLGSITPPRAG